MSKQGHEGRNVDGTAEDPERLLISAELEDAARSAAELAEITDLPLTRVRRHLREMREEGLIETAAKRSKRGTVEHSYFLISGLTADAEEWAEISLEEKPKFFGRLLTIILTEATRALVTHPTKRGLERVDSEIMRMPMVTDEAGWKELGDMHRDFRDRVMEARGRIMKRLEEEGEEGFKAASMVMFFENETTD